MSSYSNSSYASDFDDDEVKKLPKRKTWLEFRIRDQGETKRKTHIWQVLNRENHTYLGEVRWAGGWRQYVFYPADGCMWNADCLAELEQFLRVQMAAWRAKKANERAG